MRDNEYKIILTNGSIEDTYYEYATCKEAAIILAQARAINNARGYKLVSAELIE
jgi:hypothetical protein